MAVNEVVSRLATYGSAPFLVTVSADGIPKLVHVAVVWNAEAATFRCTPGKGTMCNVARAGAGLGTLVFPGPDAETHSWLVDVIGEVDPDDPDTAVLAYGSSVLHRPAPASPGEQTYC